MILWPLQLQDNRTTDSEHTTLASKCPEEITPLDLDMSGEGEVLDRR